MKKLFSLLLVLFIVVTCHGQNSFVTISGKDLKTSCANDCQSLPTFRVTNGFLSVSIQTASGTLLEISQIPTQTIHCKAKLGSNQYMAVFINENTNKTYKQKMKNCNSLTITCNDKNELVLSFNGKLYNKKSKLNVKAVLTGKVPSSENIETQQHE